MSQLPTASQTNSNNTSDDGRTNERLQPSSTSTEENRPSPMAPQRESDRTQGELTRPTTTASESFSQTRGASSQVHAILNPPSSNEPTSPHISQRSFLQRSVPVLSASDSNYQTSSPLREDSPTRRNARLTTVAGSPQVSRFLSAADYPEEQRGTSAPVSSQPLPTTSGTPLPHLHHYASAPNLAYDHRIGLSRQPVASPPFEYSTMSQQIQTSPFARFGELRTDESITSSRDRHDSSRQDSTSPTLRSESLTTQPPKRQGNYRMMTFETEQGQIPIRVDLEAASRGADEKRRRNATASARFRARRKEKEQANSKEIEDLKREIYELSEDASFYRQERDYLVGALSRTADGDRHFPRPPSPRRHRTRPQEEDRSILQPMPLTARSDSYQEQGERGGDGRHTRRRVSADAQYTVPPPSLPTAAPMSYQRSSPTSQPYGASMISGQTPSFPTQHGRSPASAPAPREPPIQPPYPPRPSQYHYPPDTGRKPP